MLEVKVPDNNKADYDYIAFSFFGLHSYEDFGIYRLGGQEETMELTAQTNNKTDDNPNKDGQYYLGTQYKSKVFNIKFAFEEITETTLQKLKQWLNKDSVGALWFAEAPHRVYQAKITGSATTTSFAFVADGQRFYKGTGVVQFTCYEPHARTPDVVITSTGRRLSGNAYTSYLDFSNYAEIKNTLPKSTKEGTTEPSASAFGNLPFYFKAKLLSPFDSKETTIQSDIVGETYAIENATYSEEQGVYIIN